MPILFLFCFCACICKIDWISSVSIRCSPGAGRKIFDCEEEHACTDVPAPSFTVRCLMTGLLLLPRLSRFQMPTPDLGKDRCRSPAALEAVAVMQ